jgi:ribulose-phosphate 3-epimerase
MSPAHAGRPVKIAPSILSADFARLGEGVQAAEEGGADWIHVDVMDGHFVPNLTLGPAITEAVRRSTSLPVDVHLMIESPERYLAAFVEAGAHVVTVHQEACRHLHRVLERIRELGAAPGVAVNPATPVELLRDILPFVDLVLVMTVNPGFGGQAFIPTSPGRVARVRALLDEARPGESVAVQVDGGIDAGSAGDVVASGADVLVAGSAIYGHPGGVAAGIRAIREGAAAPGTGGQAGETDRGEGK